MSIQMIVLDLDRTLLRTDKSISDYTVSLLDRCREKGIWIVVATARSEQSAESYLKKIRPDAIVSNGGARVRVNEKTVWKCMLGSETTASIIERAAKEEACVNITVETESGYYVTWEKSDSPDYEHAVHCDFTVPFKEDSYKITLEIRDKRVAERIARMNPECCMTPFSDEKWYRFAHKEASKMNGVLRAAEDLKIDVRNAVSFGDDLSDLDMIEGCGIGVAMGNAIELIKKAADSVCMSNDEDGVAHWIDDNIIGKL